MRRPIALTVAAVTTLAAATLVPAAASSARSSGAARLPTSVNERRIIGYSVRHRPIVAYRLGNPRARPTAVLLGQMHGDEHAGVRLARSIVHGLRSVEGIDLWVVPTMNPDGNIANTRQNAHHVDLNRNWRDIWRPLTGEFYSGPRPWSEPETRAMRDFLLRVKPHYVVVLHQPLYGVDTTDGGALDHRFRQRLATNLGLPLKAFRCWSICHGSLTRWYTTHRYGIAETVEFGWQPTEGYLTGRAKAGIVDALGGHFGRLRDHNPRSRLHVRPTDTGLLISGWAFDRDDLDRHIGYTAYVDGVRVRTGRAGSPSPGLDAAYRITGDHSYAFEFAADAGKHAVCMIFTNVGAGTADPKQCVTTA
jgi:protein MpaA